MLIGTVIWRAPVRTYEFGVSALHIFGTDMCPIRGLGTHLKRQRESSCAWCRYNEHLRRADATFAGAVAAASITTAPLLGRAGQGERAGGRDGLCRKQHGNGGVESLVDLHCRGCGQGVI